jgi:hypothetical protein
LPLRIGSDRAALPLGLLDTDPSARLCSLTELGGKPMEQAGHAFLDSIPQLPGTLFQLLVV